MNALFIRLAVFVMLVIESVAATSGILVREEKKGDCCDARLELVGTGEAFYLESRDLLAAAVHESDGLLHVEVAGKTRWVLTPQGDAWTDQENRRWVRRESLVKTDPTWTSVRIRVKDQHGKAPDAFDFQYRIDSKAGRWDPLSVRPLQGKDGVIELTAPNECSISLEIEHLDFVRGYNASRELDRKGGAKELTVEFQRGLTVRGRVVDDATGNPLAGAQVYPMVFTPPLFSEDRERSVTTGADGTFELRGVDGSYMVKHGEYLQETVYLQEEGADKPRELRLKKGLVIRGIVSDPAGKPLAGVMVDDGSGKRALSGDDGRFVLPGLQKWREDKWDFTFSKEGFNEYTFQETAIGPEGLNIKLVPLPEFRGRVVFSNGEPVGRFRVVCGPGANPPDFECEEADVVGNDGRFLIRPDEIAETGTDYWLGVMAEGAAPWEGVVQQATLERGDFRIELKPGVSLTAELTMPPSASGPVEVRLEPVDRSPGETFVSCDHPGKELATRAFSMKQGAELRIPNLRAGDYQLRITVKGATPLLHPVKVGNDDVKLGELRLSGTGSVFGRVNEPYGKSKAWRFADGQIHVDGFDNERSEPYMTFKTDEAGKFRVDGVPVGKVRVLFYYNISADMIDALSREAIVNEGGETEVRFEGEGGSWSQPLRLLFDGKEEVPPYKGIREVDNVTDREPMFRFDVLGVMDGGTSTMTSVEWSSDGRTAPTIPDLAPGRWRIRIYDWLGSRGFDEGLRAEVVADVGEKREPITIDLGSKTLSGRVTASRQTKRNVQMIAVGKSTQRVFLSRCDDEGDFVIRCLPQDEYSVHAHDDDGGWCDLGSFRLDKAVMDCGVHSLSDGGHALGQLEGSMLPRKRDVRVSAFGSDGVDVPVDEVNDDGTYRFGHMRPGKWTIIIRIDDKQVAQYPIEIKSGKTTPIR